MDEELQRRLDEALDGLARGDRQASSGDPQGDELLDLARAVRALGEPLWPEDAAAFVERLMPPARGRRRGVFVWPGAAAAVAAALLAAQPATSVPWTDFAQVGAAPAASGPRSGPMQTYTQNMRSATAPSQPKATAAPSVGLAVHGAAQVARQTLQGIWLRPDVLALRWPAGAAVAFVTAQDLRGRTARLAVRRRGPLALIDFGQLPSGWYRLQAKGGTVAVLLPPPPGSAVTARLRLAPGDQATRLQGVRLVALDAGVGGTAARFRVAEPSLAAAIVLEAGRGEERPVRVELTPAPGGMSATLVFDPLPSGTRSLRFLAPGHEGTMMQIKAVALRP